MLVLLSNHSLLLFQCNSELGCVFNLLATNQHLRVHLLDLLLEMFFMLLSLKELLRTLVKSLDGCIFVLFCAFTFLSQLHDVVLVVSIAAVNVVAFFE